MTDFFHLICFQVSSTLSHVSVLYFSLLLFIHSSVIRNLGYSRYLALMSNAAMNVQVLCGPTLLHLLEAEFLGHIGNSILYLLKNCQSGYTIVDSFQQHMRTLTFLYPHQDLLLPVSVIIAILVGMKWYLIVFLICTFLMINDVEDLLCVYWPLLHLTFKSLIHFELIFVCGCEYGIQLHSFACGCPVVPALFVEKIILSPLNFLAPLEEKQLLVNEVYFRLSILIH